jgi:hypothetical protein
MPGDSKQRSTRPTSSRSTPAPHDPLAVELSGLADAEIFRRREILEPPSISAREVCLVVRGARGPSPLAFDASTILKLDKSGAHARITLRDYAHALEVRRAVDVLGRRTRSGFEPCAFWCSARYLGQRKTGNRKPDCQFAFKLASAAKDERIAAAELERLGHELQGDALEESRPYIVTFSAALGGRTGKADLECSRCSTRFEVKGRPYDNKVRFSDSEQRSFLRENRREDLQAFVFRHKLICAFRNADIIDHLTSAHRGRDHVDSWAFFPRTWRREHQRPLPACHPTRH